MCPLKREQARRETQQWVMRRLPTADSIVEIGRKSKASSLFNLRAWRWQSFAQPLFKCSLVYLLVYSTLHFILNMHQSLSSFRSTCPYNRNLFCCNTKIMSSNPSLSTLHWNSILMPYIHLTILISAGWSAPHYKMSAGIKLSSRRIGKMKRFSTRKMCCRSDKHTYPNPKPRPFDLRVNEFRRPAVDYLYLF